MTQDGGWIQLFEVATERVRARAHLMVDEVNEEGWHGQLESIRTKSKGDRLETGDYIALFGPWSEPHPIELAVGPAGANVSAPMADEPSVLRERSEGE